MDKITSEELIRFRFWNFHSKLVEEYPEYRLLFDTIVSNAQDNGLLWEVLEFAQLYLEADIEMYGMYNLNVSNYIEALEYGYSEWVK